MKSMNMIKKARSLAEELEEKYSLDLGEYSFRTKDYSNQSGLFSPSDNGGIIKLDRSLRGSDLKCTVYHELGHLFLCRYSVAKAILSKFSGNKGFSRRELMRIEDDDEIPKGYVSLYAAKMGWEEDFCETLAAYLVNDERISGWIYYEGFGVSLETDRALKEKMKAIRAALGNPTRKRTRSSSSSQPTRWHPVSRAELNALINGTETTIQEYIAQANAHEIARISRKFKG